MARVIDSNIEWIVDDQTGQLVGYKDYSGVERLVPGVEVNPVTGGIENFTAGNSPIGGTGLTALQALSLASSRRVDLVMLGDSNQAFGGYGFSQGLEKRLSQRFNIYATSIHGRNSPAQYSSARLTQSNAVTDVNSQLDLPVESGVAFGSVGLTAGTSTNNNVGGIGLPIASPIGVNNALRCWFAHGVSPSFSGGQMIPGARRAESPWTTIGKLAAVSTTGDFPGLRLVKYDIPEAVRNYPVEARPQIPSESVTGPWVSYYTRIEAYTVNSGLSCHTIYSSGGQSAWNMAYALQNTPDKTLSIFFAEVRRLQISNGNSPVVVIYINTGVNDRNEGNTPSLGPKQIYGPGDSAAEYVDNIAGIQSRIMRIWDINRWPVGELHWLFVPSHRVSDPDDVDLVAYRAELSAHVSASKQSSMVDLGALMTYAAANSAGWYDAGGSVHLTNTGYDGVSQLIVDQIP